MSKKLSKFPLNERKNGESKKKTALEINDLLARLNQAVIADNAVGSGSKSRFGEKASSTRDEDFFCTCTENVSTQSSNISLRYFCVNAFTQSDATTTEVNNQPEMLVNNFTIRHPFVPFNPVCPDGQVNESVGNGERLADTSPWYLLAIIFSGLSVRTNQWIHTTNNLVHSLEETIRQLPEECQALRRSLRGADPQELLAYAADALLVCYLLVFLLVAILRTFSEHDQDGNNFSF